MPENAVYVGRGTRWGNPYVGYDPKLMTEMYEKYLNRPEQRGLVNAIRDELRGKNLACWCPIGEPCHADVLLRIANREAKNE